MKNSTKPMRSACERSPTNKKGVGKLRTHSSGNQDRRPRSLFTSPLRNSRAVDLKIETQDRNLRESIGLCTYAEDVLQRLKNRAVGAASLALWRTFAGSELIIVCNNGAPSMVLKNFVARKLEISFVGCP